MRTQKKIKSTRTTGLFVSKRLALEVVCAKHNTSIGKIPAWLLKRTPAYVDSFLTKPSKHKQRRAKRTPVSTPSKKPRPKYKK